MRDIRVTTRVEVIENGHTVTDLSHTSTERGVDNPIFVTRAAHRRAAATSDTLRAMLAVDFGEADPQWRTA